MRGPLSGKGVAVTRAGSSAGRLGRELAAAGATVTHWPSIRFDPPEDEAPLAEAARRRGEYDWLVLTSPRAAERWLLVAGDHPGGQPPIAAAGPATADVLRRAGIDVRRVAEPEGARGLLLAFERAGDAAASAVLLPQSDLADGNLASGLTGLGAVVTTVVAYHTVADPPDPAMVLGAARAGEVHVVTFTSPSTVEGFLGRADADQLAEIRRLVRAAAIGPTTGRALLDRDWPARIARAATVEGLVEAAVLAAEDGASAPPRLRASNSAGGTRSVERMKSDELFEAARELIPGGVNSPVRAFGSVGGTPRFIERASGARIFDVDGVEYIDYVGSWGVMLLGHDHPAVRDAIAAALRNGTSFGAPTEAEVRLARLITTMVPSIDRVRLVNSGTEATMSAVRLARGVTGNPGLIKFRGGYHGHGDSFLVEAGSGAATMGVPSSPGVTGATAADTHVAEYNDLVSVERCFRAAKDPIACVIVEPVSGNMGCVPPAEGFLEGLREICDQHDALLVFDEVMTGFRVAPGGAQERFGVMPDLTALGKILGGGLPVGAYGGRRELMEHVAPDGPVYQAGTLSGNPLATAAGLATLTLLRAETGLYSALEGRTARLGAGLLERAREAGVDACWNGVGSMGSLFFTPGPVTDWSSAAGADRERFGRFFHAMLKRGIYLAPSPFEAWFVSSEHTDEDIDRTLEAAGEAMEEAA